MFKRIAVFSLALLMSFIVVQPVLAKTEDGTEEEYFIKIRKELTIVEGDDYLFEVETNGLNAVKMECDDTVPEGYEKTEDWGVKGEFIGDRFVATAPGKTTVWARIQVPVNTGDEYRGSYSGLETIEDYCVVTVLPKLKTELLIGNEASLDLLQYDLYQDGVYAVKWSAAGGSDWEDEYYDGYEDEELTDSVTVDKDGLITAICPGDARIYITIKDGEKEKDVLVAEVTVPQGGLDAQKLVRAVGSDPQALGLNNVGGKFVIWTVDDLSVAYVDSNGLVTPIKGGTTKVSANVQTMSGRVVTLSCPITVTNPKLSQSAINLAKGYERFLTLTGTVEESQIRWSVSDGKIIRLEDGGVYAKKVGKSEIEVHVDGITLKCVVRVTNPMIKNEMLLLVKGNKKSIGLTGTNSYSKPKWSTSNKKIATVNKKGKVSTKSLGNVTISCEVDGVTFTCKVSVGKKQAVKAVKAAESAVGAKYSQARRMQKGYYDCSSLVWRAYRQAGVYLGGRSYAPTAADIAKTLVVRKKKVSIKLIKNPDKLLPGDLLFYAKKEKNGRYKNISHVAMFCGNGMIVHAAGVQSGVVKVNYWLRSDTVIVARPI